MAKKYEIDDDPTFAMNAEAKALAKDRGLLRILDEIAVAEEARRASAEKIKHLWRLVEKEGHNIGEARRRHVARSCAVR